MCRVCCSIFQLLVVLVIDIFVFERGIMEGKKDIFDKIMQLPGLNIFEPFYKKQKEILLYLFFGVVTFIISIASFIFFERVCHMNELVANIVSWILAVACAYITNRIWVFQSNTDTKQKFLREIIDFVSGRIATLIIEEAILFIFVTWLAFDSTIIKIIAQVIVIILNYIISKVFVFKN